jgi:DNA-binding CsgD family transcriptional regulator
MTRIERRHRYTANSQLLLVMSNFTLVHHRVHFIVPLFLFPNSPRRLSFALQHHRNMKALPRTTIKEAIRLMAGGHSTRETAQRLGISPSSASHIYSSNKQKMPSNKGGRPTKMPPGTVEFLKVNMKRGVLRNVAEATKRANEILPQPVSLSTVRRHLRGSGLVAKRIVKKV